MEPKDVKILVVEDEASLLKILMDQLSAEGFQVFGAKNGQEGIEMATKEIPNLMMVDVLMPKMDGLTMLAELKKDPQFKDVPTIILTNLNDTNTTAKALEVGAYDYIVKSDWDVQEVVKRVKEKLGFTNEKTAL